jgi:hypothetical protein
MDRLSRALTGGCLAVVLGTVFSASGCRSMRNDVPPGKPYSTTGGTPPTVGFSSDPHANTGPGGGPVSQRIDAELSLAERESRAGGRGRSTPIWRTRQQPRSLWCTDHEPLRWSRHELGSEPLRRSWS